MAEVTGHLSVTALQAGDRGSKEAMLARRSRVIWLLAQGRTAPEPARLTGLAPRWVEGLLGRYNRFGPSSPGDRRRGSGARPTILTLEIPDMLGERLKASPEDGGVWTSKKVAAPIATELGLASVAEQRGWEALRALGWTIQKPRPRPARAAGPEAQAECKKASHNPSPKRRSAIPAR